MRLVFKHLNGEMWLKAENEHDARKLGLTAKALAPGTNPPDRLAMLHVSLAGNVLRLLPNTDIDKKLSRYEATALNRALRDSVRRPH